jgi:hypothetical protein
MTKLRTNDNSFSNLDFFGVNFNFLIDGKEKYQTSLGAVISIFTAVIFVALFFGFGLDIFERKMPKVSINSSVGQYHYPTLNNKNFTYAYRLEDSYNMLINDTSKYRTFYTNYHYSLENETWILGDFNIMEGRLCNSFPEFEEKQLLFNISLEGWYCIDFDQMKLGGFYTTDSVYGIAIHTIHCSNATGPKSFKCEEGGSLDNMTNHLTSSGVYWADLSQAILPSMDNYENPIMQTLINKYEMLNTKLTKSRKSFYQITKIYNDIGWFLENNFENSFLSLSDSQPDFTFKDEVNQDILFSHYIYLGNKTDTYKRSYIKFQEIMAAIGGFSRIITFFISFFYSINVKLLRNFILINKLINDDEWSKSSIIKIYNENNFKNNYNKRNDSSYINNTLVQLNKRPNNPLAFPIHRKLHQKYSHKNVNQENRNSINTYTSNPSKFVPSWLESCISRSCFTQNKYKYSSEKFMEFYSIFKELYLEKLDVLNFLKMIDDFKLMKDRLFGLEKVKSLDDCKLHPVNGNNKKILRLIPDNSINEINEINYVSN